MGDCMDPQRRIARSDPDPELAALYSELRRRYPLADIQVYRQIRDSGPSHLSISIDSHALNRRRAYNLGTDTADRALCCIDEWERSLVETKAPPPKLYVACCRRCGDALASAPPGADLHMARCPQCPKNTPTDVFEYVFSGDGG